MPRIDASTRRGWALRLAAYRARLARARHRREQLIEQHLHIVPRIARHVQRTMTHIPLDELIACGNLGLVEAAQRYRPSAGVFEHYAYFRVRGAMIDAHKRKAYREETHLSIEALKEEYGSHGQFFAVIDGEHDTAIAPDESAIRRQQAHLLAEAVEELAPDTRRVFALYLAGASLYDVAAECDRTVAWARSKLAEARAQLGARVLIWGIGMDRAA